MIPTVARKLVAKRALTPPTLSRVSRRGVATPPAKQALASIVVRNSDYGSMTKRSAPACGWRKTIVSSASAVSEDDDDVPSFSTQETKLEKQMEEDLKLEVDMEELQRLASMRCTPLSLSDMYKYAVHYDDKEQRIRNAQFLHRELPIRLAQRAVDLLTLPHGLSEALPIKQTTHMYLLYLEKFQEFPVPTTPEEEYAFTELLQEIVQNRTSIPMAIARGVDAWRISKCAEEFQHDRLQQMEEALYRFFTARVGLRFLAEHHILSSPSHAGRSLLKKSQSSFAFNDDNDDFLGCIQTDCDPINEVQKIVESVRLQTEDHFGVCPEIQIVDSTQNVDSKFTYVPHHLHYMVGELLKNSCRSTVKRYLKHEASGEKFKMPQIRVVVVKGKEDVTIKVADRGGGIPRSEMPSILKFAQSTADKDENSSDFGRDEVTGTKIRGFGLPLARIYARYLGGELTLKSMEGYGLDAYLHLPRLGDSCENLPLPVKFSPGELTSNPPRRAANT
jgi:pyruvate dehydrogenase kinase 2/3/4